MSIARIAQTANVSYATAWRIINNQRCSSEQAIEAVKRAARQIGYAPPSGRRRGRPPKVNEGIRTRNIALLHLRPGTNISTSVLGRVQETLAQRNLNLIFGQVATADQLPPAVAAGNVDGILGYGEFPAGAVTPRLLRVPAVWMMSRSDMESDPWGDRVKPDHFAIGQLAARHALQQGHRHVAFMNPDPQFVVYQQRLAGFRGECERQGAAVDVYTGTGSSDRPAEAERLAEQWVTAGTRPTAVFVPVDRVTLHVYRHLAARGAHIGRDVEVISCDNEPEILALMRPQPVSIDLNRQMIAGLAVERLLWRMRSGMESPQVVIAVQPTAAGGERGIADPEEPSTSKEAPL